MKDYYQILGVSRNVSNEQLRLVYFELAKKYHPDHNQHNLYEAEQKFKEMKEAYEILSDPKKRHQYEQTLITNMNLNFDGKNIDEVFDSLYHGLGPQNTATPYNSKIRIQNGEDIYFPLDISLEMATEGGKTSVKMEKEVICEDCDGNGADRKGHKKLCSFCDGSGEFKEVNGKISICPRCSGRGYLIDIPCKCCNGKGIIKRLCKWSVHIPAGVENSQKLRLPGEGQPGRNGGLPGDLYLEIKIISSNDSDTKTTQNISSEIAKSKEEKITHNHQINQEDLKYQNNSQLKQDGLNVILEYTLNIKEAILGAILTISTLRGTIEVAIPPGTQHGTMFRIPKHGIVLKDQVGDYFVQIKIIIPKNITPRQKMLLEEFAKDGLS